jgi:hypothetical protein
MLFYWELVDCKLPFRGRRLRAQVCGVVNILQGLRAVALASGFKRREFIGDTKLSPTIIRCHHHHRIAHEKIGPPHIRTAMVVRTTMVVRKANQRATIRDIVKRGGMWPVEGEDTVRKYKRSMVRTECVDHNSGGIYVRTECGRPNNGGGKT